MIFQHIIYSVHLQKSQLLGKKNIELKKKQLYEI